MRTNANRIRAIKAIRDITGAGLLDAKNAVDSSILELPGGSEEDVIEMAKEKIRVQFGFSKFREKIDCTQGRIASAVSRDGQSGVILEVNCETDYAARTHDFMVMCNRLAQRALEKKFADPEDLMDDDIAYAEIQQKKGTIKENIGISRLTYFGVGA